MTNRERMKAVLNYERYDRLPIIHFGFWGETLQKWHAEGHLSDADLADASDGGASEPRINAKLGFDGNYQTMAAAQTGLVPAFEHKVLESLPDGRRKVRNADGVVILQSDEAGSIPAEIDHLLLDRRSWEEHYLPRLQFRPERVSKESLQRRRESHRDNFLGLHCGSLFGQLRNWIGVVGVAYIRVDDPGLFKEMVDTVGNLCYNVVEAMLATGVAFDFAHFWEDICFKNGPLVQPAVFAELCGPHYRRICSLVGDHGLKVVSVDCDGCVDALVPIWFENGVNTMFPIEVGTWASSIAPWRQAHGRELRGVGGMNKTAFSQGRAAVDAEIEKLRPLVDLGGYVPCPDHRIAPDAEWDHVRYYCDRMRHRFG